MQWRTYSCRLVKVKVKVKDHDNAAWAAIFLFRPQGFAYMLYLLALNASQAILNGPRHTLQSHIGTGIYKCRHDCAKTSLFD